MALRPIFDGASRFCAGALIAIAQTAAGGLESKRDRARGAKGSRDTMKISDLMTKEVRACHQHDSLNRAAQLMWENDCGAVPVVDSDLKVIGMLTDRDICMAAYTQGIALVEASVGSAMSCDVCVCGASDNITSAAERSEE